MDFELTQPSTWLVRVDDNLPARTLSRDVLPEPLGPIRTHISPG